MAVTFATGFTAGAVACGVKSGVPDRLDVALIASASPCVAAALYTTNAVVAAPLLVTRRHLGGARPRGIVVNSGNANACTGVIGVPLPTELIARSLATVRLARDGGTDAARAILTTDTRVKTSTRELALAGGTVRIG